MSKKEKLSIIAGVPVMSVAEVAEALGVTERTVQNYIANGKMRSSKIAGHRYITRENLDSFIRGEYQVVKQ